MKNITTGLLLAGLVAGVTSVATQATGFFFWKDWPRHFRFLAAREELSARRHARQLSNNGADAADETVSEIVAATADGQTLGLHGRRPGHHWLHRYHQSRQSAAARHRCPSTPIQMTISTTARPRLTCSGTSTRSSARTRRANRSRTPSGKLRRRRHREPGSGSRRHRDRSAVASPTRSRSAPTSVCGDRRSKIERNEDLCVGGTLDGTEAGRGRLRGGRRRARRSAAGAVRESSWLSRSDEAQRPSIWHGHAQRRQPHRALGLCADDPEPEFVDINERNEAVVTLQENNHIVDRRPATR